MHIIVIQLLVHIYKNLLLSHSDFSDLDQKSIQILLGVLKLIVGRLSCPDQQEGSCVHLGKVCSHSM